MTPPLAPSAGIPKTEESFARAQSISALAELLLDWRVDCERHLRTLTCLQRWLERVRNGAASEGECDLLIQEMERLLREQPPAHEEWTRQAVSHLQRVRE